MEKGQVRKATGDKSRRRRNKWILTDTRGRLLRRPGAVRLAEALLLAHQLVAGAAVVRYPAAERVALARVVAVRRVLRLATGARWRGGNGLEGKQRDLRCASLTFAGYVRSVPAGLALDGQALGPVESVGHVARVAMVLNGRVQVEGLLLRQRRMPRVVNCGRREAVNWREGEKLNLEKQRPLGGLPQIGLLFCLQAGSEPAQLPSPRQRRLCSPTTWYPCGQT